MTRKRGLELGLVDGFGGLQEAITMACFLGGRLDPQKTPVIELPKPPGLFEQLEEAFSGLVSLRTTITSLAREAGVADAMPWLGALLGADGRPCEARVLCLMPECLRLR